MGKSKKGNHIKSKRSYDSKKMHISQSSRSGLLNQSNSLVLAAGHSNSLPQFKKLVHYPKKMTIAMNKVSSLPQTALHKGLITLNSAKEEEFFKSVKPLIQGSKFFIAMDSGANVEQNVYLNLDLLSLHIESPNQSTCAEVIQVSQLHKTELPPATLEQIRVYKKSPEEVAKIANLYEFNFHVLE